jgi:hypothetical protein
MTRVDKIGRKRIVIFSTNDMTWLFPALVKTIPHLNENHDVTAIYLFPDRLGKNSGLKIPQWFLKVFGFYNFLLMALYSIKSRLLRLFSPIRTWNQLASSYNLDLHYGDTPNSPAILEKLRMSDVDLIFIMVGYILGEEVLSIPKIGIINKHAGLVPACRGLLPFFWSKLKEIPTGITFHEVNKGIDTGKILIQLKFPPKDRLRYTMLRFYIDVFELFPYLAPIALQKIIDGEYQKQCTELKSSYFSLPDRKDFFEFRSKSHKITRFTDLFYSPIINIEEVLNEICIDKP